MRLPLRAIPVGSVLRACSAAAKCLAPRARGVVVLRAGAIGVGSMSLFGCSSTTHDTSRQADEASTTATPEVRLVWAQGQLIGCEVCAAAGGVVEVQNLADSKNVDIVYSSDGSAWSQASARFMRSPDPPRDLFSFSGVGGRDVSFAVRYRVRGREYWDNAGGGNYRVQVGDFGGFLGPLRSELGPARDIAVIAASTCAPPDADLCVRALVRNRDFEKDVHLVWSTDDWATTKIAPAHFVPGPYRGDVEQWDARVSGLSRATSLQFDAVVVQAGATSWDSGYGQNIACAKDATSSDAVWLCSGSALIPWR